MSQYSPISDEIRPLRARIRQATEEAILASAEAVFAEQGIDGARMNDIAAGAGMAVGTLYNHFQDKDALLRGLIEKRREELLRMLDETIARPGVAFRQRVESVFACFLDYFTGHQAFSAILQQTEFRPSEKCEVVRELYSRMDRLVKIGIKEKTLNPSGAELYPVLLMGLIRAAKSRERVLGVTVPAPASELTRFFFEGAGQK